jgi:DNA-binding NtrC family response regulator
MARETTELVERRAIQDALEDSRGNVTKAARTLGISRASLQLKMREYGLRRPGG